MLGLMLLLVQGQSPMPSVEVRQGNLTETLYWASADAAGTRLCDRRRSARYRAEFYHLYGKRVHALLTYHRRKNGPDADFIFTTSCRLSRRSDAEQDREHAREMRRFAATLRQLEQAFGPPRSVP